ncbi:putative peptidase (DUF1758) domain-containing protein [Phthorimaea operculella]|nr:putative peptidase (DUF1758) domain-containing protein [Phthorimaea operculella]
MEPLLETKEGLDCGGTFHYCGERELTKRRECYCARATAAKSRGKFLRKMAKAEAQKREYLEKLIAERSYKKEKLLRLERGLPTAEQLKTYPICRMDIRRDDAISTFNAYEKYCEEILFLDPENSENIGEVETVYYKVLDFYTEQIAARKQEVQQPQPAKQAIKKNAKLPSTNIPTFGGKYSDYVNFRSLFNSVIDSDESLDKVQKLHYLRSFLVGEPLDLIKNLPLISQSYDEALKLLEARFYNKFKITSDHIGQLLDLENLGRPSAANIRDFVASVKQNMVALKNLGAGVEFWDPLLTCIFLRKLDPQMARSFQIERDTTDDPDIEEFLAFLEKRALALENADLAPSSAKPARAVASAAIVPLNQGCFYCKCGDHKIFACKEFRAIASSERVKFVERAGLCKVCLNDHAGKCRFHFRCGQCKKTHNTLVHEYDEKPVVMMSGRDPNVLLPTVRVKLFRPRDNREVHVKAVLDSCSQASLVSKKVVEVLGLTPKRDRTEIVGIASSKTNSEYFIPLEIHGLKSSFKREINFHVVDKVICDMPQREIGPSEITIPAGVQLADDDFRVPSEINMLMAADVFFQMLVLSEAMTETGQRQFNIVTAQGPKEEDGLRIVNTKLGHIVAGGRPQQLPDSSRVSLHCSYSSLGPGVDLEGFLKAEEVPEVFKEKDEHVIVENVFKETTKLVDNRFQVDLPIKVPLPQVNETLGDSFDLALVNRLKFWGLVEQIKQEFWKIYHKQYLNSLQCRSKWRDDMPNLTEGMLVILRDPNSPPLYWPMARVVRVFPGLDGKEFTKFELVRMQERLRSTFDKYENCNLEICAIDETKSDADFEATEKTCALALENVDRPVPAQSTQWSGERPKVSHAAVKTPVPTSCLKYIATQRPRMASEQPKQATCE